MRDPHKGLVAGFLEALRSNRDTADPLDEVHGDASLLGRADVKEGRMLDAGPY